MNTSISISLFGIASKLGALFGNPREKTGPQSNPEIPNESNYWYWRGHRIPRNDLMTKPAERNIAFYWRGTVVSPIVRNRECMQLPATFYDWRGARIEIAKTR